MLRFVIGVIFAVACAMSIAVAAPTQAGCATCPQSCGSPVPAGSTVSNTTWTLAGSPYCVNGDILVNNLTIQPGVCVRVNGPFRIEVLNNLIALGTKSSPITFTAKNQTPLVRWKGLRFQNVGSGSILDYCRVEYAESSGLTILNSSPVVQNCLFTHNIADGVGGNNTGGGGVNVTLDTGVLELVDCAFVGNSAVRNGGGARAVTGSGMFKMTRCLVSQNGVMVTGNVTSDTSFSGGGLSVSGNSALANCEILDNTVSIFGSVNLTLLGGGLFSENGSCRVDNCTIRSNTNSLTQKANIGVGVIRGGGVALWSGSLQLLNSIVGCNSVELSTVYGNGSRMGGGLFVNAGSLAAENSTIVRNNLHGLHLASGTASLVNSIVYFNNTSGVQVLGAVAATYCDIQGGAPFPGVGNIVGNPLFATGGCGRCDVAIVPGSPCIDAGDPGTQYFDVCSPPSIGLPRNDMGVTGGPLACHGVDANAVGGVVNYCTSTTNSSGAAAEISGCGSTSIAANDLSLCVSGCPDTVPGLFFFGCTRSQLAFGNGFKCVTGTTYRLPIQQTGPTGDFCSPVNLGSLPVAGIVAPGDVLCFQFWFRDSMGAPKKTNLSDALEVFVQP